MPPKKKVVAKTSPRGRRGTANSTQQSDDARSDSDGDESGPKLPALVNKVKRRTIKARPKKRVHVSSGDDVPSSPIKEHGVHVGKKKKASVVITKSFIDDEALEVADVDSARSNSDEQCESDTDEQMVEAQIVDDTNPKKAKGKAAAVKSTNPKKAKGKDTAVESTNPKKTKVEATAVDVDGSMVSNDDVESVLSEQDAETKIAIEESRLKFKADIAKESKARALRRAIPNMLVATDAKNTDPDNTVYLDDYNAAVAPTSDPSPEVDEVLDKRLQDQFLRSSYKGLANRSLRFITSFSSTVTSEDCPPISVWLDEDVFPNVDPAFLKKLLTFKKHQKYYNPSRVDPSLLTVYAGAGGRKTIAVLESANSPGLAVSVVSVGDCHIQRSHSLTGDGKYTKYLTGVFLRQEDLLFMSTVLMAFNLSMGNGFMRGAYFIFNCRPLTGDAALKEAHDTSNPVSPSKSASRPIPSPSRAIHYGRSGTSVIQPSLSSNDQICVLNGRTTSFEPNAGFASLASKLPPFVDEIPFGSLALVGHVISLWGDSNVSLSINWVVVLATPRPLPSPITSPVASGSKSKLMTPSRRT